MLIDVIFVVLMVLALFKGYSKGLIVALFSVLAFIVGIAAALKLSTIVANRLKESVSVANNWLPLVSFLIVFIVVVVLVQFGAKLIEKTFQIAMLGWANRLAGALLYMVLYTILFSILLFYASNMNILKAETIANSSTYAYVAPWGPKAIEGFATLVPWFKNMFAQLELFFDNMAKKVASLQAPDSFLYLTAQV